MYQGPRGLYQSGQRFSLAGMGDLPVLDCSNPDYAAVYTNQCGGAQGNAPSPGGFNWGGFLTNALTDVTQLIAPGTPSAVPVYTAASTTTASLLNNPAVLLASGVALYLVFSRRRNPPRRHRGRARRRR